jgi:Family of unknown function (DUF6364)
MLGAAVLVEVFRVGALGALGLELLVLLFEGVGDVLEEDEAEDDVLGLGRVHAAAKGIGHLPQLGFIADRRGCGLCGRGLTPCKESTGEAILMDLCGILEHISMAQLTLYLDSDTEAKVKKAAKAAGVSVSRWVSSLIRERTADEWPSIVREMAGSWPETPTAEELREKLPKDIPREPF